MINEKPMFMRIVEMIEDDILSGAYKEDDLIISTTQISKLLSVNPTTSVKAVSILADLGVLYKKRGIGMCVAEGGRERVLARRREEFLKEAAPAFFAEARKLGIGERELIELARRKDDD